MKIYTGRGDAGQTLLFSGERVTKNALRVAAYGTLDELNSLLGVAANFCLNRKVKDIISSLQQKLFTAGADLATTEKRTIQRIQDTDWKSLEATIDELEKDLPPLTCFILPGGTAGASLIHVGRTVCRRAERLVVEIMAAEEEVNAELLVYLNRLSDLLFVLARYENALQGGKEEVWLQNS